MTWIRLLRSEQLVECLALWKESDLYEFGNSPKFIIRKCRFEKTVKVHWTNQSEFASASEKLQKMGLKIVETNLIDTSFEKTPSEDCLSPFWVKKSITVLISKFPLKFQVYVLLFPDARSFTLILTHYTLCSFLQQTGRRSSVPARHSTREYLVWWMCVFKKN